MTTEGMIENVVGATIAVGVMGAGMKMMNQTTKQTRRKKGKKQKGLLL